MPELPWHILLVEDDEEDYMITRGMLEETRGELADIHWVKTPAEALRAITGSRPDVVLVDYQLGVASGVELVREAVDSGCRAPFILLTGHGSYEVDVEAMQAGATDYLSKNEVNAGLLERTVRYAIERSRLLEQNLQQKEQLRQAAEDAVRRAEELNLVLGQLEDERARLNGIITNAPSGILLVDEQARIVLSNPMAEVIYARPVPHGQPYDSHASLQICLPNGAPIAPADLPLTRSALHGEVHNNVEMMIIWPNGERRFVLANTAPLRDHEGNLAGAVAVFNDITEHKHAEEAVRRSIAQIEVQRHLMQSREKERLRIAQDLHDGPLQGLVAMTFEIKDILGEAANSPLAGRLQELAETLQAQIREIRAFSQQLRPPVLTPFGLEKAIRSHAESFHENHPDLSVTYNLDPDGRTLNEEIRLVLFRIYQELLNNIVRHAEANAVEVNLVLKPNKVELEVGDNGCGFNVPSNWVEMARQGHLGLVGVQERASSVNGFVEILSEPGKGTRVRVTVPL